MPRPPIAVGSEFGFDATLGLQLVSFTADHVRVQLMRFVKYDVSYMRVRVGPSSVAAMRNGPIRHANMVVSAGERVGQNCTLAVVTHDGPSSPESMPRDNSSNSRAFSLPFRCNIVSVNPDLIEYPSELRFGDDMHPENAWFFEVDVRLVDALPLLLDRDEYDWICKRSAVIPTPVESSLLDSPRFVGQIGEFISCH